MASFTPYTGSWDIRHSAHLLRRTTYGTDYSTLKSFAQKDAESCVNILFEPLPMPDPPINVNFENDPDVPIGDTWVDKAVTAGVNGYRTGSLRNWSIELMLSGKANIREKMTMFWHNHFVTADINDPRFSYIYITQLRKSATGNFKQLTKDITIDPAMLNYLNGRDNTRQAPNENYARELMELFTLGKGDLAGPGDYTTFTEEDVKEVAKSLTGWIDIRNELPIRSEFRQNRHDTTTKRLSHRFGNITIPNANANEYSNLIDIIFTRDEVAPFIARKLYRWFVSSHIDESVETGIITPMATIIRDSDYEIAPTLKALFMSEHFYDGCVRGAIIKNPVDFILNPVNQFSMSFPADAALKQRVLAGMYQSTAVMQMAMYQAPSVAGWQAYYQEPLYYRMWLNAASLPARKLYSDAIGSTGIPYGAFRFQVNVLSLLDQFENAGNPDEVVEQLSVILFPKSPAPNQVNTLKSVLLSGISAENWKSFYDAYIQDPTSNIRRQPVESRMRLLIVYMMRMPEFHLS